MGKLTEYLREENVRWQAERPLRESTANEWRSALNELFDDIANWIQQADSAGLIQIERDTVRHYERRLGHCELPRMKVTYEASEVTFQPRNRFAVGLRIVDEIGQSRFADGYVSVLCPNPSGHQIFRLIEDGASRWYIQPGFGHKHKIEYSEFTQEAAESLLVGLLK